MPFKDQPPRVPAVLLRNKPPGDFGITKWTGGWRPDKPETSLEMNELATASNIEFDSLGGFRGIGGQEYFTDAVTDLDQAEFFFAPRVYTDDGGGASAQPLFTQEVFVFEASDGSIYTTTFGQLQKEFETGGAGTDLTDTGQSLGNAGTGSSNYFRIWPINVITWQDNIYFTSLRFNGFSGGSGAGGTWRTRRLVFERH